MSKAIVTSAFDGGIRHGGYRIATLEVANTFPCVVNLLIRIIAANLIATDAFLQSRDLTPIDLYPQSNDQVIVANTSTALGSYKVLIGMQFRYCLLNPISTLWDEG